jgi:hypothetical protein
LARRLLFGRHGEDGSAPIAMVVDSMAQTLDTEPNNDFRAPQELPAATAYQWKT